MTEYEAQFLFLLKTYVNNEKLPDGYQFDVGRVFTIAMLHNVAPMIYSVVAGSSEEVSAYKSSVKKSVAFQTMKNIRFAEIYNKLTGIGVDVIVVKGPVCAGCYPFPDYRLSSDYDIVVSESDREVVHEFFNSENFVCNGDNYSEKDGCLYIEVSTALGEGEGFFRETADSVFSDFFQRVESVDGYRTLGYTENFVYLLYHAFKHFIGSGFGIRQITDILLFIKKYDECIDYNVASSMLKEMRIYIFACNVLMLIDKFFGYSVDDSSFSIDESVLCTDEFIDDLLSAGVFGKSSEDRLHSAALVTAAVNDGGNKKVLKTVFPSYKTMKMKFPVLKYFPFLLPFMWMFRLFEYIFKLFRRKNDISPLRSIQIADSRIELMKKMGIIN